MTLLTIGYIPICAYLHVHTYMHIKIYTSVFKNVCVCMSSIIKEPLGFYKESWPWLMWIQAGYAALKASTSASESGRPPLPAARNQEFPKDIPDCLSWGSLP